MLKGVLFDMDGVLVDSEDFICMAAIEMFREKGLKVKPSDFTPFVGTGENSYIGGVAEKYHFPLDIRMAKIRIYEIYDKLAKGNIKLLPGVRTFIDICRKKGLKMIIATSADEVKLKINLRETKLSSVLFDGWVTAEDVTHRKPAPDIYLKAAEKLGFSPEECLVVEDSPSGIRAGKLAGAKTLGVLTGFTRNELKEADWIAQDLAHVPDEVLQW